MEEELNADVIKTTQQLLGKFVKRPPLTDKLLKKPPFRFLHDIITTVLKTTGFFEGLFEEAELISDNVKDRESKIRFLSKIIIVLGYTTGKTLSVKPSKIVAGQDPAKTNELLQCLGDVLDKKLSSTDAVKKYHESTKTSSTNDKKSNESGKGIIRKHEVKKSSTKDYDRSVEKNQKTVPKLRLKEKTTIKADSPPKTSHSTTNLKKKLIKKSSQDQNTSPLNKTNNKDNASNANEIKTYEKTDSISNSKINERKESCDHDINDDKLEQSQQEQKEEMNIDHNDLADKIHSGSETEITEPEKAAEVNENNCVENQKDSQNITLIEEQEKIFIEETSVVKIENKETEDLTKSSNSTSDSNILNSSEKRPKSVRPPSSRPGAPRVKERHDNTLVGSETAIVHKVNIIVENVVPEEEEDASMIITEKQENTELQSEEQIQLSLNEHGHLVQQILDSQKEFSHISGKTEIVWQFGAQKARDTANQEIEQMRFNVQALSRISNPLGKLIDHVQEDVEVMRQELQEWTRKYEDTSKELLKQKIINSESLQPLQAKIKQLDADILEKQDKINDLRIVVHKNYYRIEKLLSSGNVQ